MGVNLELVCDYTSTAGYAAHARLLMRALDEYLEENEGVLNIRLIDRKKDNDSVKLGDLPSKLMKKYSGNYSFKKPDVRLFFEPAQWYHFEEGVKTIGFCQWETTRVRNFAPNGKQELNWLLQLNKCDHIITSCGAAAGAYQETGVDTPISVIPGPIYEHTVEGELPITGLTVQPSGAPIPKEDRKMVVGYMAQWTPRKNIEAFIRDITVSFRDDEVVGIVKTYGHDGFDDPNQVIEAIRIVRDSCRRSNPPTIVAITEKLTDEEILQFFNTIDVYYAPSRGEGFSLPVAMAVSAGCYPLVTDYGGPTDYLPGHCCVSGSFSPAIGMSVYDSNQFWCNIDEYSASMILKTLRDEHRDKTLKEKGQRIREYALKKANPERFASEIVDTILDVHDQEG